MEKNLNEGMETEEFSVLLFVVWLFVWGLGFLAFMIDWTQQLQYTDGVNNMDPIL